MNRSATKHAYTDRVLELDDRRLADELLERGIENALAILPGE
jgi:hypothetical protein